VKVNGGVESRRHSKYIRPRFDLHPIYNLSRSFEHLADDGSGESTEFPAEQPFGMEC